MRKKIMVKGPGFGAHLGLALAMVFGLMVSVTAPAAAGTDVEAEPDGPMVATFSKADIEQARQQARTEREASLRTGQVEPNHAERQKMRLEIAERSAESGIVVDPDTVDVFDLADGQLTAVVPESTEIDEIIVTVEDEELTIESRTSESEDPLLVAGGPGMATWQYDGSGWYYLYVKLGSTTIGRGDFFWHREKSTDYSSNYDFFTYKRQAIGRPYNGTAVKVLRVQNYPYDSVEPYLLDWMQFKPSVNYNLCTSYPITLSITSPFAGISTSFERCGKYTYWRNVNNPGSYWLERTGSAISGRDIEASYVWSIKTTKGASGSMHDFQRITISDGYFPPWECSRYDSGGTCTHP